MTIRDQEEELFTRWRATRQGFVADGVVDEAAYLSSSPRILFVLKEPNDPGGGGWDLRQVMRDGVRPYTWDNVTRWIQGIRNLDQQMTWSDLETINEQQRRDTLSSVAALNLKKSPGSHTTDSYVLQQIASEDKEFLNLQFSLYGADLVICCGSSDEFHSVIDFNTAPLWRRTSRGVWFHEYNPQQFVISYSHPMTRCANNILYYGLIDAIREVYS